MMRRRAASGPGRRPRGAVAEHRCKACGYRFWETADGLPCWLARLPVVQVWDVDEGEPTVDVAPRAYAEVERRVAVMRQAKQAQFDELRKSGEMSAEGLDFRATSSPHADVTYSRA